MSRRGSSRKLIGRQLNAAYACGLLSEDTYVHRVEELLGSPVVDPDRLSGDLTFRRSRSSVGETLARLLEGLRSRSRRLAPTLLGLDWDGVTSEISIGRHHGCDVVLEDPQVSRRHAQLRFRDGRWIVRDLESRNGTFVNGLRVGRCELRPGDEIVFGSTALTID